MRVSFCRFRRGPMLGLVCILAATADLMAVEPQIGTGSAAEPHTPGETQAAAEGRAEAETQAAARVFRANLEAIRQKDRTAYLATYWQSPLLARPSFENLRRGYDEHAAFASDDNWPDVFEARNLQLAWLRPGLVYGTYRYRVAYGTTESTGISERLFLETENGWKIAMTSAFPAPPGTPPPPLALTGATIIDPMRPAAIEDGVLVIRGGRFDCVGTSQDCPIPAGVQTLHLQDRWIVPGLIDCQVYFSRSGWLESLSGSSNGTDPVSYETVQKDLRNQPGALFRAFLASGVTGVFDAGGYSWTLTLRDSLRTDGPWTRATGPILNTLDDRPNLPGQKQSLHVTSAAQARAAVRHVAALGAQAVTLRLRLLADDAARPEVLAQAVQEEAARQGLPLFADVNQLAAAKLALVSGARLLIGGPGDTEIDDEFLTLMRQSGAFYCPVLAAARLAARRPQSLDLAEFADAGMRQRNLERVVDAGLPVILGSGAGRPLALHGPAIFAEIEVLQSAGLSPKQVLAAATSLAASALQVENAGGLQANQSADLLILSADPRLDARNLRHIDRVMRRGELRGVTEFKR